MQIVRVSALMLLWLGGTGAAHAEDFIRQELTTKIISLVIGVVIAFAVSLLLIYQVLWRMLKVEFDMATKLSIVIGVLLSYLWFLYLFGQVFNILIMIAFGVILAIILVLLLLRRE